MLKVTADGGSPPQLSGGRRGVDPAQLWSWFLSNFESNFRLCRVKERTLHIISHTEKFLNLKSALKRFPDKLLHELIRHRAPRIGLEDLQH